MSEWKTYRLGDVGKIITGKTPSTSKAEYFGNDYPFITPRDMNGTKYIHSTERYISKEGSNVIKNNLLPVNSVCVSCIGSDLGKVVKTTQPSFTNQQLNSIICNDYFDSDFIYYSCVLISGKLRTIGKASTAVPIINKTSFSNFEITAPDLPTQRQIAQILSSLDDKIELNLQMNQTLEAMAQAIFKEWFVHFNFPGFDGELVDGLPKGWRKVKLSELIAIKHGYAFKGEFFSDFEEDNILLTPGNFKIGGGFNSAKFKYYNGEIPQEYILQRNDLVVTMTDLSKAGDTLGYSALVPTIEGKILLHNQRIGKVLFNSELPLKYFLYWTMRQDSYRHFVLGSATGSTVKHTSPSRICDYEIVLPQEFILSEFETLIKTLSDKQQENEMQIYKLTQTRDTLLPKLMSGQIALQG